jgi:LysM repeat protein
MFEITHQKAKQLLQKDLDQTIGTDDLSALDAHLENCVECRNYANSLSYLESGLRRILHAQIDDQLPNLNLGAIIEPTMNSTWTTFFFSPTNVLGRATIGITLLLVYFMITNFFGVQFPIALNKSPTIIPTPNDSTLAINNSPTPSIPPNMISMTTQGCETIIYVIQENDTLDKIARQFGVSKNFISSYNNLIAGDLYTGGELSIPLCGQTPLQISHTPRNTTTITPISETMLPTQRE